MNPPPAIWCIGRNYDAHAREMGDTPRERPTIFFKNPASVVGDGDVGRAAAHGLSLVYDKGGKKKL